MSRWYLLAGFAMTGLLLAGLVLSNPNHGTSIDSGYYLQSAANLLAGRGYVVQETGRLVWNGTFPIGYPALIAGLSGLTGLSVLVASKLINGLFLMVSGWVWTRRLGTQRATWMLSVWWLGGFLKLLTYTWSEAVFLVLLAEWVWQLHCLLTAPTPRRTIVLILVGYALFLVRYVGGYVFALTGLLALLSWLSPERLSLPIARQRSIGRQLLTASLAGITGLGTYFELNSLFSDSAFGGERFLPTESSGQLAWLFGRALLNEGLLIRDFTVGGSDWLAWLGVGLQGVLLSLGGWRLRRAYRPMNDERQTATLSQLFVMTGFVYVGVLFILRTLSPFDAPNLRLMAPSTFCLLTAGLLWVGQLPVQYQRLIRPYWAMLLLGSWLQLLPQANLNHKLNQVQARLFVHR
ncbi:hypothetical protein HNV11_08300 [Spirosoma taeanense]|uniref:Dolichyl-phosphate-mannose-protein mannosyltransferase n=1 Tax=Spirosoma taeanense TaxID=2735870 RepID=A0A6M5Y6B8_9BACT|nr:hypothetical protein [Spirosoma taeanense]QJW89385.1 hypothetical protein HNV11_08300 [Spirosoma taeanense]